MPVNLDRLDRLQDSNLAIDALGSFIAELIADFAVSLEGKAYLESYPTTEHVGSWVEHLLHFSYVYESVTLPNMTTANVEAIVTQILMQQMDGFDPIEVDTVVPELKAFWLFLLREHQHPQALKIVEFLTELQPQFNEMMNDLQCDLADLSLLDLAVFEPVSSDDTPDLRQELDSVCASDLLDNPITSESILLSKVEQTLKTNLEEIAIELATEFPQEVPSVRELQLLLANIRT